MPASEEPRENYISSVDETESAQEKLEGETQAEWEAEVTAEERSEGTEPSKD